MPLRDPARERRSGRNHNLEAQTPSPTWERFVVTGKARAHIRRFVRLKERDEYEKLGRSLLARAFEDEGYELTDKALDGVLTVFQATHR